MTATDFPALVDTRWVAEHLDDAGVILLDGSYFLPNTGKSGRDGFEQAHLPGAQFFDIDAVKDAANPLPHMVPPEAVFAEAAGALGISNQTTVIVYDQTHIAMAAARVWWMFRLFGHDAVAVMNGGLPKWLRENRKTEHGAAATRPSQPFTATLREAMLVDENAVKAASQSTDGQIVDARDPERFAGRAPEIRPGIRSGHMPGALNLPFPNLIAPDSGTMLPPDILRQRIADAGIDLSKPVISSCGSGVTACVLALAAAVIETDQPVAVYDGSWTEWGREGGPPIETG